MLTVEQALAAANTTQSECQQRGFAPLYCATQDFGILSEMAEETGAVRGFELGQQVIPEMKMHDIRSLLGGDCGCTYNPHGRNARDLELFVNLFGYSPIEAHVAATQHGGEHIGLEEQGWLADLLLVHGGPTSDVTILQDRASPVAIMKDGKFNKAPSAKIMEDA